MKPASDERGIDLFGEGVRLVSADGDRETYSFSAHAGRADMTAYRVFPGITLVYANVTGDSFAPWGDWPKGVYKLDHCLCGRLEWERDGGFCYIEPGDMSIACAPPANREYTLPLSGYNGISVLIDTRITPKCLSCFMADVCISPEKLMNSFSRGGLGYIARSGDRLEHIFSELYSVPEEIRKGYFKVKILELLLFLSTLDIAADESLSHSVSASQVSLARRICAYMTEHMETRITLNQLSHMFHVSGTGIKNSFKAVYGQSLYSYMRTQKMQSAAMLLRDSDLSVLDVAGKFGYDNASKFAKAFKDCHGVTPVQYRKSKKCPIGAESHAAI